MVRFPRVSSDLIKCVDLTQGLICFFSMSSFHPSMTRLAATSCYIIFPRIFALNQIIDAGEGKGLHRYLSRTQDIAIGRACCAAAGSIQDAKLLSNTI